MSGQGQMDKGSGVHFLGMQSKYRCDPPDTSYWSTVLEILM